MSKKLKQRYIEDIQPRLKEIEKLKKQGLKIKEICKHFNIAPRSFFDCRKMFPELGDIFKDVPACQPKAKHAKVKTKKPELKKVEVKVEKVEAKIPKTDKVAKSPTKDSNKKILVDNLHKENIAKGLSGCVKGSQKSIKQLAKSIKDSKKQPILDINPAKCYETLKKLALGSETSVTKTITESLHDKDGKFKGKRKKTITETYKSNPDVTALLYLIDKIDSGKLPLVTIDNSELKKQAKKITTLDGKIKVFNARLDFNEEIDTFSEKIADEMNQFSTDTE